MGRLLQKLPASEDVRLIKVLMLGLGMRMEAETEIRATVRLEEYHFKVLKPVSHIKSAQKMISFPKLMTPPPRPLGDVMTL